MSTDSDPKEYFVKSLDASIKERFVLRLDPNPCNHVSEKGYTARIEEGNKYLKNFRSDLKFSDVGPKVAGHQFIKIFPFKFRMPFSRPTELPPIVTDIEGHKFYDSRVPSDQETWFKADEYGPQNLTATQTDDDDDEYFKAFTISPDLMSKKREFASCSSSTTADLDAAVDSTSKKTKKSASSK
jgi:hypothetical protein